MSNYFEESMAEFVEVGKELYNDMIHNFENMFDGDTIIKHFDIHYGNSSNINVIEIIENYGDNIQKELISWIRKEFEDNNLFIYKNWKPFRSHYHITSMFFGYKKLFQYKQYYFQLTIDDLVDKINERIIHFELAACWSKEDGKEYLQPDNDCIILSDNIMPEYYWNISESFWHT